MKHLPRSQEQVNRNLRDRLRSVERSRKPASTSSESGVEFIGPSMFSGDVDAVRANGAEIDLVRQTGYASVAAVPTQNAALPVYMHGDATDSAGMRLATSVVYAKNDAGTVNAGVSMWGQVGPGGIIDAHLVVGSTSHTEPVTLISATDWQGLWLGRCSTAPPAPTAAGYVFVRDNGSGKDQLCVRFKSGAVQVIATEP